MKIVLVTGGFDPLHSGHIEYFTEAKKLGDVLVVAPNKPQSGMGHAITITKPLRLEPYGGFEKIEAYSCSGTPVDCVKLGVFEVLKRKPDLLLSGINHGENSSTNVLYSGTMSAAIEGAMEGIPSIGFSLADFDIKSTSTLILSFISPFPKIFNLFDLLFINLSFFIKSIFIVSVVFKIFLSIYF